MQNRRLKTLKSKQFILQQIEPTLMQHILSIKLYPYQLLNQRHSHRVQYHQVRHHAVDVCLAVFE